MNLSYHSKKLDEWHETYKDFIEEKSINNDTGKSYCTHQKVRDVYRSLRANLAYTLKVYLVFL
jgi:hypothetical protein